MQTDPTRRSELLVDLSEVGGVEAPPKHYQGCDHSWVHTGTQSNGRRGIVRFPGGVVKQVQKSSALPRLGSRGVENAFQLRIIRFSTGSERRGTAGELYGQRVPSTTPDVVVLASVVQTKVLGGEK